MCLCRQQLRCLRPNCFASLGLDGCRCFGIVWLCWRNILISCLQPRCRQACLSRSRWIQEFYTACSGWRICRCSVLVRREVACAGMANGPVCGGGCRLRSKHPTRGCCAERVNEYAYQFVRVKCIICVKAIIGMVKKVLAKWVVGLMVQNEGFICKMKCKTSHKHTK